ncbi:MAG: hypothetical protein LBJ62_10685 [Bifidobacteriaceae bacterium]|jgi:signal transduction histidine kinase|nr:hypothetical protein [Bifidobacteriaceae bacterium]
MASGLTVSRPMAERWVYLSFAVPLMLVVSAAVAVEWMSVWSWLTAVNRTTTFTGSNIAGVWALSFVPAILGVAAMVPFYPEGEPWTLRILLATILTVASGALRLGLEYVVWGGPFVRGPFVYELIMGLLLPFSSITIAMYFAQSQVRSVVADRRFTELEFAARQVALERENAELKVRRELSTVLHDRIQQRLVYAATRLQTEVVPLATGNKGKAAASVLGEIIADIDNLREDDVRQLSHSLFPLGVDVGLHQAIALAVGRVPDSIRVDLNTSHAAEAFDSVLDPQWDMASRAVLVEILDEAITNALKHGQARTIVIGLDIGQDVPGGTVVLTVTNDGHPVDPARPFSGLANHRLRAQLRGGGLSLGLSERGETRLRAWLPIHHPVTDQLDAALTSAAELVATSDPSPDDEAASAA